MMQVMDDRLVELEHHDNDTPDETDLLVLLLWVQVDDEQDELVQMEIQVQDEYEYLIVYLEVQYFMLDEVVEVVIVEQVQGEMVVEVQVRMVLLDEVQEQQIQVEVVEVDEVLVQLEVHDSLDEVV